MPANPLSDEQLAEAAKLKSLFSAWQRMRKDVGLPSSQEAVSGLLGFNQSAVSQYLNGSIPLNVNAAIKWAEVLGCAVSDFSPSLTAQAQNYAAAVGSAPALLPAGARRVRAVESDDPTVAHIRKVQLRVSAGIMGFTVDPEYDDGETLSLDLRWIARKQLRPENLVAIAVKGESMEPSLYEDDIVFIDTSDKAKAKQDGVVYVFNYEGEVVIKRLSRDVGEWWLTSDSSDQRKYHRKVCRDRECIIVGRVVRKESDRI